MSILSSLGIPDVEPRFRQAAWDAAMRDAPVTSLECEAMWAVLMFGECSYEVAMLTAQMRIFCGIEPHIETTKEDEEKALLEVKTILGVK